MRSNARASISGPTSVVVLERRADAHVARRRASSRASERVVHVSWTISRRSDVQRWPAVPTALNRIARVASSRSAVGATIIALLPPSSSRQRPSRAATTGATARPMRVAAGRADQRHARVARQRLAELARRRCTTCDTCRGHARRMPRQRRSNSALAGERGQRRLLRRLPHHRVAAHQREREVPRPDRDREVERADHADRPERMPGLHHAVARPLRRDRQAVELARQADREVADVDHLLHFAEAFLQDLAGLEGDQRAERLLVRAQLLAEAADQLAALAAPAPRAARGTLRARARSRRPARAAPSRAHARELTRRRSASATGSSPLQVGCAQAELARAVARDVERAVTVMRPLVVVAAEAVRRKSRERDLLLAHEAALAGACPRGAGRPPRRRRPRS